jgi:hypothetical protein
MKIRKILALYVFLFFLPSMLLAQNENVDLGMIYKIKQEGQKNSQIQEMAFWLTDFIGPRLTGSTGNNQGNEWAKKKMEELGFQNVRIEAAGDFSRGGWDNMKSYAAMTRPYYTNFACNPVAWTGSTNGLIKGEVVLINIKSEDDFDTYRGKISGKIVLIPSVNTYEVNFEPLATRLTDSQLKDLTQESAPASGIRPIYDFAAITTQRELRMKISKFLNDEAVAVILNNSGIFNVPGSGNVNYKSGEKEPVAELNLSVEAHARMERLIRQKVPVEMEIEIQNNFFASPKIYNVFGEITGSDKLLKNEVVLLGAHIDSWHGGTGAADNASGCIVMMEALRILKNLDCAPRRTIRVALWGGEEQGLNGSRGYAEKYLIDPSTKQHKPDYEKFAAYFNMDNGTGRYR